MAQDMTREEVADLIDRFLDGTCGPYDWDDFTSVRLGDPELEVARQACVEVNWKYPSGRSTGYRSAEGRAELRSIAAELRKPKREAEG